jgi:hypothetical protein
MNTKSVLLSVVLFLVSVAQVIATDIPGGVVFSNGKDAIYREFQTGTTKNLTSNYSWVTVKDKFACNGKTLVWWQDGKFWSMDIPLGTPKFVPINKAVTKNGHTPAINDIIEPLVWQDSNSIKNMTVLPDNEHFLFDGDASDVGWVCLDPGKPDSFSRLWAAGQYANFMVADPTKSDLRFEVLPLWVKRQDTFHGIFCLGTNRNRLYTTTNNPYVPVFGGLIDDCPAPIFKCPDSSPTGIKRPLGHGLIGGWRNGRVTKNNDLRVYNQNSIKKNAVFAAVEPNGHRIAYIYQIGNQWGPIEIKTIEREEDFFALSTVSVFDSMSLNLNKDKIPEGYLKPRELEIQTFFPSVEGLAWIPGGSLTIFSQGKVFLIKENDIAAGFARSRVVMNPHKGDKKYANIKTENNILTVTPEPIAQNIQGDCFNWISSSTLIWLGQDGNMYVWRAGVTEKLMDAVGNFSYCPQSPFENIDINSVHGSNITHSSGTINAERFFKVGAMEFAWQESWMSIWISVKEEHSRGLGRGFVIPDQTSLEEIINPAVYEYQTEFRFRDQAPIKEARINIGQIIIFPVGSGSDYVGLKLLKININKEHPLKNSCDFEWKVWKGVPPPDPSKIVKTKTLEEKAEAEGWKVSSAKFKEEFEMLGVKFNWDLYDSKQPGRKLSSFRLNWEKTEEKILFMGTDKEQLNDLSEITFYNRTYLSNIRGYGFSRYSPGEKPSKIFTLLLKIGNDCLAVAPLTIEKGGVVFKTKEWHDTNLTVVEQARPPDDPYRDHLPPQNWKISAVPIEKEFSIGNINFLWQERTETVKNGETIFSLSYEKNGGDKNPLTLEMVTLSDVNEDDPSKNVFTKLYNQKGHRIWICPAKAPEDIVPFSFRLGQQYVLIAPVERRKNFEGVEWIQYKWKAWPEERSELLAQATALE